MITTINEYKKYLLKENLSFELISFDDIVTDTFIHKQLESDLVEYYVTNYKQLTEQDNLNNTKILKSADFIDWLKDELSDKIDIVEPILRNLIHDNKITIYRSITTDDKWFTNLLKSKRNIGTYWAYDAESAEPHWGYDNPNAKNVVLIKSTIDIQYVDWVNTFQLNIDIDLEDEHEITVLNGAPIQIEELTINNKPVKLSTELKNKIFYA